MILTQVSKKGDHVRFLYGCTQNQVGYMVRKTVSKSNDVDRPKNVARRQKAYQARNGALFVVRR